MRLFDPKGGRKYLTIAERDRFLKAAELAPREARTLCMTLAQSGCRLSEALALTADSVDLATGVLVFETLKKAKWGFIAPCPSRRPCLMPSIWFMVCLPFRARARHQAVRLWPWSRITGWRAVHAVIEEAQLSGVATPPKGLWHAFGVATVSNAIPLNLVQKWLGHAQLSTTAIYANASGVEEQDIAQRMWGQVA